jgi:hypothetical protein
MSKVNPHKKIQRYRTVDELRQALDAFCTGKHTMSIPPQDDDTDSILRDGIEELLELRTLRIHVASFVQCIAPLVQRK